MVENARCLSGWNSSQLADIYLHAKSEVDSRHSYHRRLKSLPFGRDYLLVLFTITNCNSEITVRWSRTHQMWRSVWTTSTSCSWPVPSAATASGRAVPPTGRTQPFLGPILPRHSKSVVFLSLGHWPFFAVGDLCECHLCPHKSCGCQYKRTFIRRGDTWRWRMWIAGEEWGIRFDEQRDALSACAAAEQGSQLDGGRCLVHEHARRWEYTSQLVDEQNMVIAKKWIAADNRRKVLSILKCLRDAHLDFPGTPVTCYILKVLMLYECEKHSNDIEWENYCLGDRIIG